MSNIPTYPPTVPHGGQPQALQPHRGTAVLVLGILGLVICVICGIIAWVMGSTDLREMEAGRMDPSGMGMTRAGKICGMISCILALIGVGIGVLMLIFGVFAATAGVSQM